MLILSLLFFVSIFADKIGYKYGVPALLLFLAVGMFFGSHGMTALMGMRGVEIEIGTAQALSTLAMCIILFTGGMETRLSDIKSVLAPGITLATLGVMLTCVITGGIIYFIFGWIHAVTSMSIWLALLMAATMSSTDSASVFSVLRTNGIGLKHNLRPLLELESGANDPMAYVLTTTLIGVVINVHTVAGLTEKVEALPIIQTIVIQLVMGTVLGLALGEGLVLLMRRVKLGNESLYPIMILTACIFIFAITHYLEGNTYRFVCFVDCLFLCAFHDAYMGHLLLLAFKEFFPSRHHSELDAVFETLYHPESAEPLPSYFADQSLTMAQGLIDAWRRNREFLSATNLTPNLQVMITATMSAGKSTLVNALTGHRLCKTQNLACTQKIHAITGKAFEDGYVSKCDGDLILDADERDLMENNPQNAQNTIYVSA